MLLQVGVGAALMAALSCAAPAQDIRFEHARDIGTDAAHANVEALDKTTRASLSRFGGKSRSGENLQKSELISGAPDGRVSIGTNRIQMFDKAGRFPAQFGEKGSGEGQFSNLHGIYCDPAAGWLSIADTASNRAQMYQPVKTGC